MMYEDVNKWLKNMAIINHYIPKQILHTYIITYINFFHFVIVAKDIVQRFSQVATRKSVHSICQTCTPRTPHGMKTHQSPIFVENNQFWLEKSRFQFGFSRGWR